MTARRTPRPGPGLALVLLAAAHGCADHDDRTLTVFAAASTAEAIQDAADRFERETGIPVRCNFAASSTLARQIEFGARADVFVSAHPRWCDHLEQRGLVDAATRRDLFANRLVIVVPNATPGARTPFELTTDTPFSQTFPGRIALGDPAHVPAGVYARQALETLGHWDAVRPRVISAPDVRSALRLAELGEVDAALVYASDAAKSEHVRVAARFPELSHDPILYPLVLTRDTDDDARAFAAILLAPETAARFRTFGFLTPER